MKKKTVLPVLIAGLVMTLALSCAPEETTEGPGDGSTNTTNVDYAPASDFQWEEISGDISITNYIGSGGDVNIPPTIDGKPVTAIGEEAFESNTTLSSVTIPDSVTTIGWDAFSSCDSLTSVSIGNSVTYIGLWAFYGCGSLISVSIGNSVTNIGDSAFGGCDSLSSISVDSANPNYSAIDGNLFSKDGSILIQYAIGKSESSYTIPNSVTYIWWEAFEFCDSLSSVTIPNSVTNIGLYAFGLCDSLRSVTVNASNPPTLGGFVFYGNAAGRKFYVPSGSLTFYQTAWSDYSADIESQ